MAKRTLDILVALVALIALAPLLGLVALLVKLTSRGPVLFHQSRVGLGGRDFTIYKFRSMTVLREAHAGTFDAGDRSRVTAVGRLLRATKLDELPQLWNVLRGDMSLVGPRPEIRKWVDTYPNRWARVLTVKPGITDPASIVYRNEEDILAASDDPQQCYREVVLPRKLDLYERYVQRRSFIGDLGLIVQTAWVVLAHRGHRHAPAGSPAPAPVPHDSVAP